MKKTEKKHLTGEIEALLTPYTDSEKRNVLWEALKTNVGDNHEACKWLFIEFVRHLIECGYPIIETPSNPQHN